MLQWAHDHRVMLSWAAAASVVMFIASVVAVPALVVRIPADYFAHADRPPGAWSHRHRALRLVLVVGKNAIGLVLVLAGVAMLVLPGQGLLTILIGFLMIDFPGKYRVEKWMVSRPRCLAALNWLRRRAGRAALRVSPGP